MEKLSPHAEEILESMWIAIVEEHAVGCLLSDLELGPDDAALNELVRRAYVEKRGDRLHLRKEGRPEAEMTVRRHRLAERLMMDILDIQGEAGNDKACEFEHLLHEGVEAKICTLLNHPTTCPHGKPIPPGPCCDEARKKGEVGVVPLTELKAGQAGEIAYMAISDGLKLQKLMSMGVLPGNRLELVQRFPSYVFKVGNSQFAVDDVLAREIHIRNER
ncbi:metal-dependent transcriptional regulator [Geopsychrobacter electrodiphilus]|uniref:metal-dependent transcriptional regulator n=1 Tax=Geopsychrobacter electrodiphilus TaxID=225196 RepID=UPI00037FC77D|nr:metal-dependent transcriptional regulator [Geopsychrobacter electrodiphilus]